MKDFVFMIIVLLCCLQFSFAKTYLLIGLAGCGKSTTGNALINKSGDQKLLSIPFKTSDGASGCTANFEVKEGKNSKVVDTIGFGDPNISHDRTLENLRKGLSSIDNKLNGIIFVVKGGRISDETVNFFKSLQNLFRDKFKTNSILILTHIREGWVKEQSNTVKNIVFRNTPQCCVHAFVRNMCYFLAQFCAVCYTKYPFLIF